uniref:ubiquitinyl hydrolase 1 n=1 Tax=Bionectria ochroleuca TaxID=29856 RepID=A0A0B7JTP1_BIOOC
MDPEIRVILDVGAQIIDLSNKDVAKAWLNLVQAKQDIQAVVFCDDEDELSVLDRQGHIERLQTSPFAKHLDACLVFLDEAHTRGIDLRLPQSYRAAVTLGANLVKDRLVQACMRMRKLGHGQSVVFYVPEEIETKVRALRTANSDSTVDDPINVLDVLAWSISETWIDIRRSFPIWATQGNTFARQNDYWESMCQPDGKIVMVVISPYEANELRSEIAKSKRVKAAEEGQEVAPDGFIRREKDDQTCDFAASPVKFLKAIIGRIRFNCEGIEKTHLGKILEGALLTEDDFRGEL